MLGQWCFKTVRGYHTDGAGTRDANPCKQYCKFKHDIREGARVSRHTSIRDIRAPSAEARRTVAIAATPYGNGSTLSCIPCWSREGSFSADLEEVVSSRPSMSGRWLRLGLRRGGEGDPTPTRERGTRSTLPGLRRRPVTITPLPH